MDVVIMGRCQAAQVWSSDGRRRLATHVGLGHADIDPTFGSYNGWKASVVMVYVGHKVEDIWVISEDMSRVVADVTDQHRTLTLVGDERADESRGADQGPHVERTDEHQDDARDLVWQHSEWHILSQCLGSFIMIKKYSKIVIY